MSPLVVAVARYGVFVVALGAVVVWLLCSRAEKVALAVQVVVTVVVVAALVRVAGVWHSDPRPFVVDPRLSPLFPHRPDNGFPSDHTALASSVAVLVAFHRRWVGLALLGVSVALGVSRVAAHVHHPQDVIAGLAIGAVAALCGLLAWQVGSRDAGVFTTARRAQATSRRSVK